MKKNKILVVDDDEPIRELLADFFASSRIGCDGAASSQAALALLSRNRYSLIFLDYNLREEKAPDMVGSIREKGAGAPIILLTGAQDMDESKLGNWGIADLVYKPFHLDRVMEVAKRFLEMQ